MSLVLWAPLRPPWRPRGPHRASPGHPGVMCRCHNVSRASDDPDHRGGDRGAPGRSTGSRRQGTGSFPADSGRRPRVGLASSFQWTSLEPRGRHRGHPRPATRCDIATSLQGGQGVVCEARGAAREAAGGPSGSGTHIVQKTNDSCSLKKNLPISFSMFFFCIKSPEQHPAIHPKNDLFFLKSYIYRTSRPGTADFVA